MPDFSPQLLSNSSCLLGESPVWDPETETLYWIDIVGRKIWKWSECKGEVYIKLPQLIGGLAKASNKQFVVATERGIGFLTFEKNNIEVIGNELVSSGITMNDCKCDKAGRLIAGSKILKGKKGRAYRFVIEKGEVKNKKSGFRIWNGPAFSPEGDKIYFADSPLKKIYYANYNVKKGRIGWARTFAKLGDDEGYPDGMTVDAEGKLWSAQWGGWCVVRYNKLGQVDLKIKLPVPNPTSLTFGGPDYKTLYITSAREGMSEQELSNAPLSGGVFAVQTESQGLEETMYTV